MMNTKISYFSILFSLLLFSFTSCSKKTVDRWNVEIKEDKTPIQIIDISQKFYDENLPFSEFKAQFPFFVNDGYSSSFYEEKRKDTLEKAIYQEAIKSSLLDTLKTQLPMLFGRIKHYFPEFKTPKIYIYSSAANMYQEPVMYNSTTNEMIVDLSSFLGEKSQYYSQVELYFTKSMNAENLLPKISKSIAYELVPYKTHQQKFLDDLVYHGKVMLLQDAFLPNTKNELKIDYTTQQYSWAIANEPNIWNYFVENDLLFSDDTRLPERFIFPAPFSKFYTEIDNESSPQVGIFIGWQMLKEYTSQNPKTELKEILKISAIDLFNQSKYSPKY